MKWGIIGTGNMGSMLASSLIKSGAISGSDLTIYNRSIEKANILQHEHQDIHVASSLIELQNKSDILFLCVKPHDYKDILNELKDDLTKKHCLVSITSPVSVHELESAVPCQVARIVPSITNHAFSGVSLFTVGSRVDEKYEYILKKAFSCISKPVDIEEPFIRVSSDIVSCGPAFISFLLSNWIHSAHEVAKIPEDKATKLTESMIIGLGELLAKKIFTLEELMEKVTVKGGVTGEGLQALENNLGGLFHGMFEATQKKHLKDKSSIDL